MKIVGFLVVVVLQVLYNSNHTNYIEIHTQRIVGLKVRALFPLI